MTNYEKFINKISESEEKLKEFMFLIEEYGLCWYCANDYPNCQADIMPDEDLNEYCSKGILKFLKDNEKEW